MASLERRGRLAFFAAGCLMLLPIHTFPLQAAEIKSAIQQPPEVKAKEVPAEADVAAQGIASYYARRYEGRRTTSGVRYHPEKMTAAHQDLPFGTKVKVTNLANGKEVVVTVNDRCRKRTKPFIDLSRAAARKLGFLGKGIAKVKIVQLEEKASLQ